MQCRESRRLNAGNALDFIRRRHNDGSVSELQTWLPEMLRERNVPDAYNVATSLPTLSVRDDSRTSVTDLACADVQGRALTIIVYLHMGQIRAERDTAMAPTLPCSVWDPHQAVAFAT